MLKTCITVKLPIWKGVSTINTTNANIELDKLIEQLKIKDPYWNKCDPCQNKGKCCIQANPEFSQDEWNRVTKQLETMDKDDYSKLFTNFQHQSLCPFRTENKCLIHEARPLNCKHTPFQAFLRNDGKLIYSMITDDCDFKTVVIEPDNKLSTTSDFVELNSFVEKRQFLLLNNWVLNNNQLNIPQRKALELLSDYFAK